MQFFFRCQTNFGRGPVAALPRTCSPPGRCARAGSPFAAPPLLDFPAPRKKNCLPCLTVDHFWGHDSRSLRAPIAIVFYYVCDQAGTGYRVPLAFESDIRSDDMSNSGDTNDPSPFKARGGLWLKNSGSCFRNSGKKYSGKFLKAYFFNENVTTFGLTNLSKSPYDNLISSV